MQGQHAVFPSHLQARSPYGTRGVVPVRPDCHVAGQAFRDEVGLSLRTGRRGKSWHDEMTLAGTVKKDGCGDLEGCQRCRSDNFPRRAAGARSKRTDDQRLHGDERDDAART